MSKQNNAEKKKITICLILAFLLLLLLVFLNTPTFKKIFSPANSVSNSEVGNKAELDTTPPVVKCDVKTKTLVPGDSISIHKLGLKVQDSSEIESILFTKISSTKFYTGMPEENMNDIREAYRNGIAMEVEELQFSYGGIYTLTVCVRDVFYNTSELELTITVEEPPQLEVPNNFYVTNTSRIDFASYVKVWDFIEEDLDSSDVEIDTSNLNLSSAGTYPVVFTVTDRYGLTTTKTANVHVSSSESLQTLLAEQQIDLNTDVVLGTKNAHDIGYYKEDNITLIQTLMLPCIVHIENDSLDSFGSGFIIEISDSFVTLVTNEHVIRNDLIVDVSFFDGQTYDGSVVASNAERDIAFIRIPIDGSNTRSSISSDYSQKLRSVHINKGYWDSLANDCKLPITYNCIDKKGNVWQNNIGYIVEKEVLRDWNEYKDVKETIVSFNTISGTSGSALFDGHGQLIGMIRGYTNYDEYRENIAVPLSEILNYFEAVFKYKIHYM